MNRHIIYIAIALAGVFLVIISLGLYLIPTVNLNTAKGTVDIVYPQNYIKSGLFAPKRYLEYTLRPSRMTKSNTPYLIVVDNDLVRREDKISWSALELGILKPKTITHSLTSDEYTAVSILPKYEILVYEVRPERDANYLMIPFIYVGVLSLAILAGFGKKQPQRIAEPHRKVVEKPAEKPQETLPKDLVQRCMECDSFKAINGTLQCSRQTCKYN